MTTDLASQRISLSSTHLRRMGAAMCVAALLVACAGPTPEGPTTYDGTYTGTTVADPTNDTAICSAGTPGTLVIAKGIASVFGVPSTRTGTVREDGGITISGTVPITLSNGSKFDIPNRIVGRFSGGVFTAVSSYPDKNGNWDRGCKYTWSFVKTN